MLYKLSAKVVRSEAPFTNECNRRLNERIPTPYLAAEEPRSKVLSCAAWQWCMYSTQSSCSDGSMTFVAIRVHIFHPYLSKWQKRMSSCKECGPSQRAPTKNIHATGCRMSRRNGSICTLHITPTRFIDYIQRFALITANHSAKVAPAYIDWNDDSGWK